MKPSVQDVWDMVAGIAPPELAEKWDNIGLQAGDPEMEVTRTMLALDITPGLFKSAMKADVQMVITHHPVIFHPLKNLLLSNTVPRLITPFIEKGIAIAAVHTNLDAATGGVNDVLADTAGLIERKPLIPAPDDFPGAGIGRIGRLAKPERADRFISKFCKALKIDAATVVGDTEKEIVTVAVCGGSGSDMWPYVLEMKADLFITGEIKHNIAVEAAVHGIIAVDAGHWATEYPVIPVLAKRLREIAHEKKYQLEVLVFDSENNPFKMTVF